MFGVAEISAGFGALKAAKEIVQGLDATRQAIITGEIKVELLGKIIEAQQAMLAAQEQHSLMVREVDGLRAEVERLKDWSGKRADYELTSIRGGGLAYMPKPAVRGAEPAHWLCTNCFENAKKSILQPQGEQRGPNVDWKCPACKGGLVTDMRNRPTYQPAEG